MSAFRLYEPSECGIDGYPSTWHDLGNGEGVKHLVREQAGKRCVRCGHPYAPEKGMPRQWTSCDERCTHPGPVRFRLHGTEEWGHLDEFQFAGDWGRIGIKLVGQRPTGVYEAQAAWRILTVHHLRLGDDAKRDLRWWNLAALCQRCHLSIQGKVQIERIWPWPHAEWFKPYAAGWYAWSYLGEDLTREQVEARMEELLALECVA